MGDELPLFPLPHFYLRLALDGGVADGVHEALAADPHLPLAPPLVLPPLTAGFAVVGVVFAGHYAKVPCIAESATASHTILDGSESNLQVVGRRC